MTSSTALLLNWFRPFHAVEIASSRVFWGQYGARTVYKQLLVLLTSRAVVCMSLNWVTHHGTVGSVLSTFIRDSQTTLSFWLAKLAARRTTSIILVGIFTARYWQFPYSASHDHKATHAESITATQVATSSELQGRSIWQWKWRPIPKLSSPSGQIQEPKYNIIIQCFGCQTRVVLDYCFVPYLREGSSSPKEDTQCSNNQLDFRTLVCRSLGRRRLPHLMKKKRRICSVLSYSNFNQPLFNTWVAGIETWYVTASKAWLQPPCSARK
jgi:hypothetical protein